MHELKLRPHHGLCIYHFTGNGYTQSFADNMASIIQHLRLNPSTKIQLTVGIDAICEYCPNNHRSTLSNCQNSSDNCQNSSNNCLNGQNNQQGICLSDEKVAEYDRKCLDFCGLQDGEAISWEKYDKMLTDNALYTDKLSDICRDCQWYEMFCSL